MGSNARDIYSGPNQDQPGADGYWDMPYPLNENNTDHYPLVPEYSSMLTLAPLASTTVAIIVFHKKRRNHAQA